jgi:hypothetical protein
MKGEFLFNKFIVRASVVGTLGCSTCAAYQQRRSLHENELLLESFLVNLECQ